MVSGPWALVLSIQCAHGRPRPKNGPSPFPKWPFWTSQGTPCKITALGFTRAFPGAPNHVKTHGFRPLGIKTTKNIEFSPTGPSSGNFRNTTTPYVNRNIPRGRRPNTTAAAGLLLGVSLQRFMNLHPHRRARAKNARVGLGGGFLWNVCFKAIALYSWLLVCILFDPVFVTFLLLFVAFFV